MPLPSVSWPTPLAPAFLLATADLSVLPDGVQAVAYAIVRDSAGEGLDAVDVWIDDDEVVLGITAAQLPDITADRVTVNGGTVRATSSGWEVRMPCA